MRGGSLIREVRRRAGLTQAELGERLGTTQSAIARWERGVTEPAFFTVIRAIRACGLDLDLRLVPLDEHDDTLFAELLELSPAERVGRHQRLHEVERRLAGARPIQ